MGRPWPKSSPSPRATSTSERRLDRAVAAVIEAGRKASLRHWVPATSGNFSARIDDEHHRHHPLGHRQGRADPRRRADRRPRRARSARLGRSAAALRALSRPALGECDLPHPQPGGDGAVACGSRQTASGSTGWELLKALAGVRSHEAEIDVPVFRQRPGHGSPGGARFAAFRGRPTARSCRPAIVIAGHGLYAWGTTPAEAWRHTEALETLLTYQLNRKG